MNHYYDSIQGWFSYEWLYRKIVEEAEIDGKYHFVEVGSWKGRSTSFLGVEIVNSKKQIRLDAVDTWEGSEEHHDPTNPSYQPLVHTPNALYECFLKNIEPIKQVVYPIRMSSIEASKLYEDESLDFVMIDAAHDYENVLLDIQHWYPKIAKGGFLAGDDLGWVGVKQAADEYFGKDYFNISDTNWLKQKN